MEVEIWSDIACPWCYVGKRRFEAALAAYEHRDEVTVTWRSFELDPQAPATRRSTAPTHLAEKYGMTASRRRRARASSPSVAAAEGLDIASTSRAAATPSTPTGSCTSPTAHGLQDAMNERLMRAYFTEGEPIGDATRWPGSPSRSAWPRTKCATSSPAPLRGRGPRGRAHRDVARNPRRPLHRRRSQDRRGGRPPARGPRRAAATGAGG